MASNSFIALKEAVFTTVSELNPVVVRWLWSADFPTLDDVTYGGYEDDANVFIFPNRWTRLDAAATSIQRVCRGVFCRQRLRIALNMSWHAVRLQSWWRGIASRWPIKERLLARQDRERKGIAKMKDVVSLARMLHSTRQELKEEKELRDKQTSALNILWEEVRLLKEDAYRRKERETAQHITNVQRWWRGVSERNSKQMKVLYERKKKREKAAINIQASIRGVVTRIRLHKEMRRKAKEEGRIIRLEKQLSDLNEVLRNLLVTQEQQCQQGKRRRRRRGKEEEDLAMKTEVPKEPYSFLKRSPAAASQPMEQPIEVMDSWDSVGSPMMGSPEANSRVKVVDDVVQDVVVDNAVVGNKTDESDEDADSEDDKSIDKSGDDKVARTRLDEASEFTSPGRDGIGLPMGGHQPTSDQTYNAKEAVNNSNKEQNSYHGSR